MRLEGVAGIVTGGGSGLGKGVAENLVASGAKVVLLDLNESNFQCNASGCGADGSK
jgi:NAD(P)-dependent dehydrogenase (short-subunit alcohol dehydrogenase family)